MAEGVCGNCGTSNPSSAAFCSACDNFLGWTQVIDISTLRSVPATAADAAAPQTDRPAPRPQPSAALAPVVSLEAAEVVVAADAPGALEISLKNDSSIVDSYTVQASEPPAWLSMTHGDTNLLPGQVRQVVITLAVQPKTFATAQRLTVPLQVRSTVDSTKYAEVSVDVVVPKSGPPATLRAHPNLIRLEDRREGTFSIHLDNKLANFPRRYRMSATDPEGAVAFDFVPPAVDVPAGATADATVRFTSPQPPPGQDLTRQLTVTAADDDARVDVQVTLAQATSPEPERVPVRLRLEPSQVTAVDSPNAEVGLVVDNRTGHQQCRVALSGRDPANAVSFVFDRTTVTVPPGRELRFPVLLGSALPPRGESVSRPFTIVAHDERASEVEVAGTLELASRPSAISTARLWLHPEHLAVSGRRGTFTVQLDNRYGAEALHAHLSGADEFGRARITFSPADLAVAPGQVGRAAAVIEHPKPAGGSSASLRVRVLATSGVDAIYGDAVFTQHAPSRRRLWAILLVLLGAALMVLGAILYADDPATSGIESATRSVVSDAMDGVTPDRGVIRTVVAGAGVAIVLLCSLLMLFGLIGRTGRSIRFAALLGVVGGVAATVSASVVAGLPFVLAGSVLAFVGGILIRPAA